MSTIFYIVPVRKASGNCYPPRSAPTAGPVSGMTVPRSNCFHSITATVALRTVAFLFLFIKDIRL